MPYVLEMKKGKKNNNNKNERNVFHLKHPRKLCMRLWSFIRSCNVSFFSLTDMYLMYVQYKRFCVWGQERRHIARARRSAVHVFVLYVDRLLLYYV